MSYEAKVKRLMGALNSMLADLPQKMGYPADWVYYDMPFDSKLELNEFLQLKYALEQPEEKLGVCVAYSTGQDFEQKKQFARGQFVLSSVGLAMIEAALAGPGAM